MSNPAHPPQDRQRFVVGSEPPIRPLFIAAVGSLVGAFALVAGFVRDTGWMSTLGVVLMVFCVGLAAVALAMRRNYRTAIITDTATLTLVNGSRRRVLRWQEIADVTLEGSRLVFTPKGSGRRQVVLVDPKHTGQPMFIEMVGQIRARLDASRGYGSSGAER